MAGELGTRHRGAYAGTGECPRCDGKGERKTFWTSQIKECERCGGRGRIDLYYGCGCDACKPEVRHATGG